MRTMNRQLLLVAVSLLVAGLFGCGEQTPTQAFNEWKSAIVSGKIDAANKLTADAPEMNDLYVMATKDDAMEGKILKSGTVIAEEVKGDKAFIKMQGGDGKTVVFTMRKSDGKWKLSHKEQK